MFFNIVPLIMEFTFTMTSQWDDGAVTMTSPWDDGAVTKPRGDDGAAKMTSPRGDGVVTIW
jgi:hypothetical protein